MIKKILQDNFFRNNIVFFVGSMIVAVLNYLYHPILGRMMAVDDFGEVQTLISLFTQLAIVAGIFSVTIVNIASNMKDETERSEIISELRNISIYITGGLFFLIVIFSRELESFLNFKSFYPFISLGVLLLLSTLIVFRQAYLQGNKRFKTVSLAQIIASGGKLFFGILFVYLGWKSFGAITALIIAQVFTLWFAFVKTKKDLKLKLGVKINLNEQVKKELKFGLLVFFATSCITFFYTADVVIIKHYFSPDKAGLYSGIATVARIIFFIAGPTAAVLLPSIKLKNGYKNNEKMLKKALLFVSAAGLGVLLIFSLFYDMVIQLLIGSKYLELAPILPKLSILLFAVSVTNVIFYYFLALRRYFLIPISIISVFFTIILTYFRHGDFMTIINNFLFGIVIIYVLIIIFYAKTNLSHRSNS
ncbi:MAG: oligosaccharide flippase family protein [Patescibacteria group bacterium]|nr:oligosaccharide flippase family protein [Patescibacteria group bacterium]